MTDTTYTSDDVVRLAGITYRNLDYWTQRGWIVPSVAPGVGSGKWRQWAAEDVRRVCHLADLVRIGLTPSAAAQLLDESDRRRTALDPLIQIDSELSPLWPVYMTPGRPPRLEAHQSTKGE